MCVVCCMLRVRVAMVRRLQQKALGPNHADVTAIRDVLQSLDADEGM